MIEQITLHNFCGFQEFSLDAREFTLLVGPNNGGKTTVLRAIKFCVDAYRAVFMPEEQPVLERFREPAPRGALDPIAQTGGVSDPTSLYFQRRRAAATSVSLRLGGSVPVTVRADCETSSPRVRVRVAKDEREHHELDEEEQRRILSSLASFRAEFLPPPSTVSAVESVLDWQALQRELAQGRFAETWRNRLHWMTEGDEGEAFQRVINRVSNWLGSIEIRRPRRGRSRPQVEVVYSEDGVEYDVSSAGAGVRTILTLAAAIEMSDAPIILFDEPDSHLHSSIQRQVAAFLQEAAGPERQVFVTSHAPDFIEETEVDSIVWIDRNDERGQTCDNAGRALVELGAVSHTHALATVGADAIVYVEGKPDRTALRVLLQKIGGDDVLERVRLETLRGHGDTDKLAGVLRVIRSLRNLELSMAVILDADYSQPNPTGSFEVVDDVLQIRLPCKELENLLLMSPASISEAVQRESQRRAMATPAVASGPADEAAIRQKIVAISRDADLKQTVENQWLCSWAASSSKDLNAPGVIPEGRREFERLWNAETWRIKCCPGKKVLKRLRDWLQDEYSISVSTSAILDCYEPSDEIRQILEKLRSHLVGSPA